MFVLTLSNCKKIQITKSGALVYNILDRDQQCLKYQAFSLKITITMNFSRSIVHISRLSLKA